MPSGNRTRIRAVSALATKLIMARTTGTFFVMGGMLGGLVTAVAPGGGGHRGLVFVVAAAAVVLGSTLLWWGPRAPRRAYHGYVLVGTLLITVAAYAFPNDMGAIGITTLYVFVACDAASLFTWRQAMAHGAAATVACLGVLPARGGEPGLSWWSGIAPAGVMLGAGVVVGMLTRLASEAEIDALTGLLNRRGFERAAKVAIDAAARDGQGLALAMVGLDRFGEINERQGMRVGDTVLQQVSEAWSRVPGPGRHLARYGGDVFALLLPEVSEQAAVELTEQLRSAVSLGCSAGVTSWQPGESSSLLVGRADVGLYRAKRAGRNRTVLESARQQPLAAELRAAIARGALDVHYQPIVSLAEAGRVTGVEALLRWSPGTQPDVPPDEVVRIAEKYDLIADLDEHVLRRACRDAFRLQDGIEHRHLMLHVNISGLELAEARYPDRVGAVLTDTGWPAEQLVLEVTESVLVAESPTAVTNLRLLRERGVRIAIDDFGTGYSSLGRLATLPSDIIKVDRSFVAAISSRAPAPPLLGVIAALSAVLNLQAVAEGVETEQHVAVLSELGFTLAQGYYYSRPLPVSELVSAESWS